MKLIDAKKLTYDVFDLFGKGKITDGDFLIFTDLINESMVPQVSERVTPKEAVTNCIGLKLCPRCRCCLLVGDEYARYCPRCGQAIAWDN